MNNNKDNIDSQIVRNLAIEVGEENIALKDLCLKQANQIEMYEKEIEHKDQVINALKEDYENLSHNFEALNVLYTEKLEELSDYIAQYKELTKAMQIRRAESNKIINDLEKALLRQSKKNTNLRKEEFL